VPSPLIRAPEEAQQELLDRVRAAAAEISAQLR
jgi:DNA-binding IclR family transcriptional regulator